MPLITPFFNNIMYNLIEPASLYS